MSIKHLFIVAVFSLLVKVGFAQTNQIPQFNSAQEKEAWIKAHPAEYQKMVDASASNTSTTTATTTTTTSTPAIAPATDPTFPQYVNTGNKEQDDANYKAAKEAWIQANPEKYAVMTGQPK